MAIEFKLHEEHGILLRASLPRQQEGEAHHRIVLVERRGEGVVHPFVVWYQIQRQEERVVRSATELLAAARKGMSTYFAEGDYCSTRKQADEAFERRLKRGYTEDMRWWATNRKVVAPSGEAERTVLFDDGNGTVLTRMVGSPPRKDGLWLELGPSRCPYVHHLSDIAAQGLTGALVALGAIASRADSEPEGDNLYAHRDTWGDRPFNSGEDLACTGCPAPPTIVMNDCPVHNAGDPP